MYAYSENTEFQFKNLCGVLKIHLQQDDTYISRIDLTAGNGYLSSYFVLDGTNEEPALAATSSSSNSVTLNCSTPQSIGGSGHDFYIYLPPSPEGGFNLTLKIYNSDGTHCTKTCSNVVVERNMLYNVTVEGLTFPTLTVPTGAISGLFSVSDTKQVFFSQGNLQWSAMGGGSTATNHNVNGGTAAGTWRFAEHQYDYVGSGNENISDSYTGWIDLFGWGTSGWNSGANAYQPYSTSTEVFDYVPGGNITYNSIYNTLTGDYANADWGVYNAISNGGNTPNVWRTLTGAEYDDDGEWDYLMKFRSASTINGTPARYAEIRVYDGTRYIPGLLLFPDVFSWPSAAGTAPTAFNQPVGSSWDDAPYYTLTQFAALEAAGCVFLPTAGYRNGTSYINNDNNQEGHYWSASPGSTAGANDMKFNPTDHRVCISSTRSFGYSVRLVQDYNQE